MPIYEWNSELQIVEARPDSLPYRSKWACFDCRKSFVRNRPQDAPAVVCPDCGEVATDMGYLFEAPPKRDLRAWQVMRVLGDCRVRFSKVSSKVFIEHFLTGSGALHPDRVRERVEDLIRRNQARSRARVRRSGTDRSGNDPVKE